MRFIATGINPTTLRQYVGRPNSDPVTIGDVEFAPYTLCVRGVLVHPDLDVEVEIDDRLDQHFDYCFGLAYANILPYLHQPLTDRVDYKRWFAGLVLVIVVIGFIAAVVWLLSGRVSS